MNNIIFLDIDGVLNYLNYFIKMKNTRVNYNKVFYNNNYYATFLINLLDIDQNKLYLLKEIIRETNSKVVISSSWRNLKIYPLVEDYLIKMGIPVIGTTPYINSKRGLEIKTYLKEHKVDNYIILDDDIFPDFDEELLSHLIHTNFYNNGLDDDNVYDAAYKLKK